MRTFLLILAVTIIVLLGCAGREHLSPGFGQSVRMAFRAQVIHPDAGNDARAIPGLDPQEAAAIADAYFRSLAPARAATRTAPMLVVEEPEKASLPPPLGGPK